MVSLSPSQQEALDHFLEAYPTGNVFTVWTREGCGTTTILKEINRLKGGVFISMKTYIDEIANKDPLQFEETLERLIMNGMDKYEVIIMDDLHLIYSVICGCGYRDAYPRAKFVEAVLTSLCTFAVAANKKLIFGFQGPTPTPIANRCYYAGFKKFTVTDYEFFGKAYLSDAHTSLDFTKIYQYAPKLNAHQLRGALQWFVEKTVDTDLFLEYLRNQRMASNVDLGEVEAVELSSLKGIDDVIEALEANIIVPLEQNELAAEYKVEPKRGVLLAGPPGTGKTTVGRALAHRLKSKFFLIDGTFISGSDRFYSQVAHIFEAAKNNAPAIIFIDDSDVIFENKEDFGLYRYLLTMLDGLEGESNKRVCLMMTTMDVSSIPPALVRSGRIELWLETRLPETEARLEILKDCGVRLPEVMKTVDFESLAEETEGLTGADLRRLIDDAKILYAFDKARNHEIQPIDTYFRKALSAIRKNKEIYKRASQSRHKEPSFSEFSRSMASAMAVMGNFEEGM
ncbi:MAG TPA: ATP-binding protein [Oculatellaceae cyanobacterium]